MSAVAENLPVNPAPQLKKRPSLARKASKGMMNAAAKAGTVAVAPVTSVARTLSGFLNKSAAAHLKENSAKGQITLETPAKGANLQTSNNQTPVTPLTPFTPEETSYTFPATDNLVGEAVKVLDEMTMDAQQGEAGTMAVTLGSGRDKPVEPPAVVEVGILKHGVLRRGSYQRRLVVGSGKVVTLGPRGDERVARPATFPRPPRARRRAPSSCRWPRPQGRVAPPKVKRAGSSASTIVPGCPFDLDPTLALPHHDPPCFHFSHFSRTTRIVLHASRSSNSRETSMRPSRPFRRPACRLRRTECNRPAPHRLTSHDTWPLRREVARLRSRS